MFLEYSLKQKLSRNPGFKNFNFFQISLWDYFSSLIIQMSQRKGSIKRSGVVRCQKCLKYGHYTYECENQHAYRYRPSRTVMFKQKIQQKLDSEKPPETRRAWDGDQKRAIVPDIPSSQSDNEDRNQQQNHQNILKYQNYQQQEEQGQITPQEAQLEQQVVKEKAVQMQNPKQTKQQVISNQQQPKLKQDAQESEGSSSSSSDSDSSSSSSSSVSREKNVQRKKVTLTSKRRKSSSSSSSSPQRQRSRERTTNRKRQN